MRHLIRSVLLAYIFAVPWEYSLDFGEPFGNVARFFGLVLLAAAVPAILLQGRFRKFGALQWMVLALFLWYGCTYFWTIDQAATLIRLRGCFQVMIPVWLIWEFADTPEDLRHLFRAYVAGCWLLALLTISSLASTYAVAQIRFAAEGQDPNDTARFLDLGLPLAALLAHSESSRPWRSMAAAYLPVALLAVVLTASRSGFLLALVAVAGWGLMMARRQPRTAVAALISLPAFAAGFWALVPRGTFTRIATIPEQLQRGDLNQRLNIWSAGWHAFTRVPFAGSGAATFVDAARLAPIDTAHNTILSLAVEGGVVALILASAIVVVCGCSLLVARGSVRLSMGTALALLLVASLAATVEQNRTTWLLIGLICLAGRLSAEDSLGMQRAFPTDVESPERLCAGQPA